jgi:hypothetical protein
LPRSPPFAPEIVSADSRLATSSNFAPPTISARSASIFARTAALSAAVITRGIASTLTVARPERSNSDLWAS